MASDEERLSDKRFDALEPHELAQLYALMTRLQLETPQRRTRRYEQGRRGARVDMRRTLRGSLRTGGDPIRLARRRRRVVRRRLVLLCDISGSMEPYARAYLQFLTCAAGSSPNAEAFVFATRLTRLTRALAVAQPRARDPARGRDRAGLVERHADRRRPEGVQRPPRPARDGARRRRRDPLGRLGARRPGAGGREMERLARLAHRIVWVNPRVSASAFSVQAGGMVAAVPHCDALVSGHSFAALGEVVAAIGGAPSRRPRSRPRGAGAVGERDARWRAARSRCRAAMARAAGRTTPGWVTDD